MCEDEVLPRALQNHFWQTRHLTTLEGLWMPQYLYQYQHYMPGHRTSILNVRASVGWQLNLLLLLLRLLAIYAAKSHTGERLAVVIVDIAFVVVVAAPSRAAQAV